MISTLVILHLMVLFGITSTVICLQREAAVPEFAEREETVVRNDKIWQTIGVQKTVISHTMSNEILNTFVFLVNFVIWKTI